MFQLLVLYGNKELKGFGKEFLSYIFLKLSDESKTKFFVFIMGNYTRNFCQICTHIFKLENYN